MVFMILKNFFFVITGIYITIYAVLYILPIHISPCAQGAYNLRSLSHIHACTQTYTRSREDMQVLCINTNCVSNQKYNSYIFYYVEVRCILVALYLHIP